MVKRSTLWVGDVKIVKNCPGNSVTYQNRETVSTKVFKKGIMIDLHDNRSKKEGKIVLGPAFLRINKEVDEGNNKRIVMYLYDSTIDEKKIKLEIGFQGTKFFIERDGKDIFDEIVVW